MLVGGLQFGVTTGHVLRALRFGCILHDDGTFRDALHLMTPEELWPSWERKCERLPDHLAESARLVAFGDHDAAQDQIRASLTALSRAELTGLAQLPAAEKAVDQGEEQGCGPEAPWSPYLLTQT